MPILVYIPGHLLLIYLSIDRLNPVVKLKIVKNIAKYREFSVPFSLPGQSNFVLTAERLRLTANFRQYVLRVSSVRLFPSLQFQAGLFTAAAAANTEIRFVIERITV